jgi:hypothetical protein
MSSWFFGGNGDGLTLGVKNVFKSELDKPLGVS